MLANINEIFAHG
ncbi:Putative uncharacterized protein [Lacticaseibacillus paracasei]|nr:Putative uncharacterized protein [Lacticaseibacillus paracasei]